MPTNPLITVVVPCKNPGLPIRSALASIWEQRNANYRIIVVDGASRDGTLEWLEAKKLKIDKIISEQDDGVYSAMNKAVALVEPGWVLFLGADDRLATPTILREVSENLEDTSMWASGNAVYNDGRMWLADVRPKVLFRNFVHHQATFYRSSLFENVKYDQKLQIQGDYELNLHLWKSGLRPKHLALTIANCGAGGLSDSATWLNYSEEILVRRRYFSLQECFLWDMLSIVRFLYKRAQRKHILRRV